MELNGKVYIQLAKEVGDTGYTLPRLMSLSPVKMGPFPIVKKIPNLAYKLDILESPGFHPVISVVHPEQAPEDDWNHQVSFLRWKPYSRSLNRSRSAIHERFGNTAYSDCTREITGNRQHLLQQSLQGKRVHMKLP